MKQRIAVLLHNVRSTHNVGSIFRTSEAAGVEKIYLSGYTPTPRDRFGRARKDIAKTALGAEKIVPWERIASPAKIIKKLGMEGWTIVGAEQDKRAIDYRKYKSRRPTLFIFGNEVKGIPKSVRDACGALIEIPMHGRKESLNVSVAAGIILFTAMRRCTHERTQIHADISA
ncbi:MAG: TrmH family RNA methyltransferase [Patescibacteria group bacterium]